MLFQDCKAGMDGGGLLLQNGNYQQSGTSNVTFVNCTAFGSGGGIGLWRSNFTQHAGHLSFQKCFARHGGGIYVNGSLHQSGVLEGMDCAASTDVGSGGLISAVEVFLHGQIYANGCEAQYGGCIAGRVNITGGLKIQHCYSSFFGGAVFASEMSLQGEISILNCSAGDGGAIYSKGSVVIENAQYISKTPLREIAQVEPFLRVMSSTKIENFMWRALPAKWVGQLRHVISTRPDLLASLPVLQMWVVPCMSWTMTSLVPASLKIAVLHDVVVPFLRSGWSGKGLDRYHSINVGAEALAVLFLHRIWRREGIYDFQIAGPRKEELSQQWKQSISKCLWTEHFQGREETGERLTIKFAVLRKEQRCSMVVVNFILVWLVPAVLFRAQVCCWSRMEVPFSRIAMEKVLLVPW